MKKIIAIALMLGLCGGAAMYLSSCAQLGGPLSPDLSLLSANSTNKNSDKVGVTITGPSSPTALSETAKVAFDLPMDAASLNTSSILVYTQNASGTNETLYPSYAVSYNVHSQILSISPTNGAWSNDMVYHVVVTTAVRTITGNQVDGNGNGIAESGEFDNVHATFSLGTPLAPGYINHSIAIEASVAWTGGWTGAVPSYTGSLTFGSEAGNIQANYVPLTVTVTFSPYVGGSPATVGPNFGFDSSTFYTSASQLHSNVVLTDASGNPVTVSNIEVLSGTNVNDQLRFVLNATPGGTVYKLKILGGLSGVRASSDSSLYLGRGFYFDGDSDNWAEASDDTEEAIFSTADVDNAAMPVLAVTDSSADGCGYGELPRRIKIDFSITTNFGSGTIDPTTVNANTILLIDTDASPDEPITLVSFETDNSTPGAPIVYAYVPTQFYDDTSGGERDVQLIVRGVKTAEGLAMDQNGDGVAGQADDYYISPNAGQPNDLEAYNHAY